ncbi:hypothetical protein ACFL96_20115 [Thermoproteota archaeon]
MKIDNCPKKLNKCNDMCPEYPCWAYDEYMNQQDRVERKRNEGWD